MAVLDVRGLRKTIDEGAARRELLWAVDLQLQGGERVALLGRSGAGKSTLLNLLAGIDQADEGRIRIAGETLTGIDERTRTLLRRRHVGLIYQAFNLIPTLTVAENVALPLELLGSPSDAAHERARTMLCKVDLDGRAESYPDRLSGGEQQRIAVARALVHSPALVLADEPTGNLDAESGEQVLALLDDLASERDSALLLVTHSHAVAARCDRVLTLVDGHLHAGEAGFSW